jgi:lysophospholipase L1-like esterase
MRRPREGMFHFAAGVLMTTIGFGLAGAALIYQLGPFRVGHALGLVQRPAVVVNLPPDVDADLVRAGSIGDNSAGLHATGPHESFMVEPDATRGFKLRPNMGADLTVLRAEGDPNFDPPIIAVPAGARLTDAARRFLDQQGRVQFHYRTNADGRRVTQPDVEAADQILIVGDSVAFGVGVNDDATSASQLQRLLGTTAKVINAAVPGYSGFDAAATAEQLSASRRYRALIYVACDNDFIEGDHEAGDGGREWRRRTAAIVARLQAIAGRFDGVVIVLVTPLEYEVRDVLLTAGMSETERALLGELRVEAGRLARTANFAYDEWSRMAGEAIKEQGTVFAPFALYADHVHLSPAGNRLLAERLAVLLGPL